MVKLYLISGVLVFITSMGVYIQHQSEKIDTLQQQEAIYKASIISFEKKFNDLNKEYNTAQALHKIALENASISQKRLRQLSNELRRLEKDDQELSVWTSTQLPGAIITGLQFSRGGTDL